MRDKIPVFSLNNEYTDNYERIAHDHILAATCSGENPFIPEKLWVEMENSTVNLVSKYLKGGCKILDVGVGLGRLLNLLPGVEKYGMDISLNYLKVAQSKGIDVCYSLIEDMPYQEGIFDIVVCTDVLEHVIDLNLVCQKIISVLKKGGIFIVRVPYKEDLSGYLKPGYPYKYAHFRSFDENSLRLLLEGIFKCQFIEYTPGGYYIYDTRLKCQLPIIKYKILEALTILKRLLPFFYMILLPKLLYPVEINMCFIKK